MESEGRIGGCTRGPSGELRLGGVDLRAIARATRVDAGALGAARHGTPAYVYSLDGIEGGARELVAAFGAAPHLVAYALKANSAAPVVRAIKDAGCGADVVSGGELALALGCGIDARKIVFSGVAKLDDEIDRALAAGEDGIAAIQMESVEEIARIAARAKASGRHRSVRVSMRVNPGLSKAALATHDHVATGHDEAKFGIALADLARAREALATHPALSLVGVGSHVGSQLTHVAPYADAARELFALARSMRESGATDLRFVDCGGGFGIDYGEGCDVRPRDFVKAALAAQEDAGLGDLHLYIEPGRSLVAAHGVLLATVVQTKASGTDAPWLFVDAGMNDLVRPAMYGSRHRFVALDDAGDRDGDGRSARTKYRIAGPVCESSDDFGAHELPTPAPRDVAILDAGAYGFTMACRYNGRALPAEVFLRGGSIVQMVERAATADWVGDRLMPRSL